MTYELKKYSRDEFGSGEGSVEHVELHRNGKMVAMAHNRGDGGSASIEIWPRNDEAMFKRGWKVLRDKIADFTKAGFQYRRDIGASKLEDHVGEYDEDAVADALLFEAKAPEDMAYFMATITGHPVIMGRRTGESLPAAFRPLPGRTSVMLTSTPKLIGPATEVAGGLDEVLAIAMIHTRRGAGVDH